MGAGPPVLGPGYTLPGAEYFALSPNRSIALGPRLAGFAQGSAVNVPAEAALNAEVDLLLVPQFQKSSGIFGVRLFLIFIPAALDFSGSLEIRSIRFGVGVNANDIFLDLGIPLITLQSPPSAQLAVVERDSLITGLDLGPSWTPGPLFLSGNVVCFNNDPTTPHSFSLAAQSVFHSLEGFVQ